MKTWPGTLPGTACLIAIVVAGVWYANDPQMQHFPLSTLASGSGTSRPVPDFSVNLIEWSSDGRLLLSLSRGGLNTEPQLTLHDVRHKTQMPIDAMGDWCQSAALAADGQHVLIGSNHGRLWWITPESSETPVSLVDLPVPASHFSATAVASDGRQVCGGTNTGLICDCDLARQTSITLTASQKSSVLDLRFSKDNQRLLSAQGNGHVSMWELSNGELSQEFAACAGLCRGAAFLPDGRRLITAGLDDTVRIWDIAGGRELWRGEFGLCGVMALDVSADGFSATWGGWNHKIVVWDLEHERKKLDIATPAAVVFRLRFSPDGLLLAAAGSDGTIRLYDAMTGAEHDVIEMDASHGS
jgi:WD40 repeat protein